MTLNLDPATEKDFVTKAKNDIQSAYDDILEQLNNLSGWSDTTKEAQDKEVLKEVLDNILTNAKTDIIPASEQGTEEQQKEAVQKVVDKAKSDFEFVLKQAEQIISLRKSYDETKAYIDKVKADEADASSATLTDEQKQDYKEKETVDKIQQIYIIIL